jgi:colanic acid biosynthesis glycosyl transferase WcaI
MRILLLGLNFLPELVGIGHYSGEMAQYLAEQGHDVSVITTPPYYPAWKIAQGYSGWRYQHETIQGMNVIRCPIWIPKSPSNLNRLPHLLSFALSSFPTVLLHALRRKPDVVFCIIPTLFSAPFALLTAKFCKAKTWLHIQDFELDAAFNLGMLPGRRFIYPLAKEYEKKILTHFDRISTISEHMRLLCIQKGVNSERTSLLLNWVDTKKIHPLGAPSPLRAELNISAHTFVALYHGNMGRKQGLELLIETARLLGSHPRILLVLCGDGPAKQELLEHAASLSNIRFIGLQPEEKLNDLVNLADVHLLPQLPQAADLVMPSKLNTILASGKPVIAGANPGTQVAQVLNGIGIIVQPEDPSALAKAILNLIDNPTERCRLGYLSRAYARQNLDKNLILSELQTALLHLP